MGMLQTVCASVVTLMVVIVHLGTDVPGSLRGLISADPHETFRNNVRKDASARSGINWSSSWIPAVLFSYPEGQGLVTSLEGKMFC